MKKIAIALACALLLPMAISAAKKGKKVSTFKDCYIYGQSNRNSQKKGSALSLTTGMTYSLANADPRDIDVLLYFGKVKKSKVKNFNLFAPNDPTLNIDWEKDGGTSPFCKFEGKSSEPDAYYALKNWKTRNSTKIERIENIDFDNITGEAIEALPVSDSYMVQDIKVGDVILFELAETSYKPGHKGLIKVLSIEDDEEKPEKAGQGQYQRITTNVRFVK